MAAPYYDKVDIDKKFDIYRKEMLESLDSLNTELNGKVTSTENLTLKASGVYRAETSGTIGGVVVKEGYYTLLRKKEDGSWVLESEVKVNMSEYGGSNLIESSNYKNKNAFKSLSLKGNWKNQGLWIETLAYTSFNKKLNLVIKDKTNKDIFVIAGKTVDGRTEIELISALIEGTLVVDFSDAVTFQEVVNYPFVENQIFDNNNYLRDVNFIPDLHIIADKNNVTIPNRILAKDDTNVPDANYSITDLIPVRKGMNLTYRGKNNASATYFDLAHIYDEFGAIVQKINRPPVDVFFKFDITAETAYEMRLVVSNESKENFILVNNKEIEKPKRVNFENIDHTFITGSGVAFDGSIISNESWNRTGLVKVNPNSEIGYVGLLTLYFSVALYDANQRFIKSVLRTSESAGNVIAGRFTTTDDTMYMQASVSNNRFFRLFYVSKDSTSIFHTLWQGYKNGEDFKLTNGIAFKKQKTAVDTWENVIEMNNTAKLHQNFLIENRNYYLLQNKARIEKVGTVAKGGVIYGHQRAGDTSTISESKDGGLTYTDLFTITDSKINSIDAKIITNADGVLYIQAEVKTANFAYAEKILYRAEKVSGVWVVDEVLTVPHGAEGTYVTFAMNMGFSTYQNIVVVNDYGSQGTTGRLWVSTDYGKTFTKKLDINTAPYNTWIVNGHLHGSAYDPVFSRIWVSTGDGYTNTYVLYSDDLGVTWSKVQAPFKDENGNTFVHTQFVGIFADTDFVLFNHDSSRAGVYRYNRGKKSDIPKFEWVADITNHSNNELATEGLYAGASLFKNDGIYYSLLPWHDTAKGDAGILGKLLVSKDGYNWDVFFQDIINTATGRGYIANISLLFVNDDNVIFNTENDKWVYLDKPSF